MTTNNTTTTDRNRALVTELFARFARRDVEGIAQLLHDDFVSHNPTVPHNPAASTGRDAFLAFLRGPVGQRLLSATVDVRRLAVDGDHVWVHNRLGYPDSASVATVDVVRVRDGLVAEHWDVVQPVPDAPANPHGMF